MYKEDNVETKSVPSFGKWSVMNMELTPLELITETQIYN